MPAGLEGIAELVQLHFCCRIPNSTWDSLSPGIGGQEAETPHVVLSEPHCTRHLILWVTGNKRNFLEVAIVNNNLAFIFALMLSETQKRKHFQLKKELKTRVKRKYSSVSLKHPYWGREGSKNTVLLLQYASRPGGELRITESPRLE